MTEKNSFVQHRRNFLFQGFLCFYGLFLLVAFYQNWGNLTAGQGAQIGLILMLILLRITKRYKLSFLPDSILFSLPLFWTITAFSTISDWFEKTWPLAAITMVMAIAISIKRQLFKKVSFTFLMGTSLAIVFIVIFAGILRTVFPKFESFLLRRTIENVLIFIGILVSGQGMMPGLKE